MDACSSWKNSPSKVITSPVSSRRKTSSDSSIRRPRVRGSTPAVRDLERILTADADPERQTTGSQVGDVGELTGDR